MKQRAAGNAAQTYRNRRRAVARRVQRTTSADAAVILNGADIRYLSGSTEGVSALLFGSDWAAVFTSRMFRDRVPRECPGCEAVVCTRSMLAEAAERLEARGCASVGFQEGKTTLGQYRGLCRAIGKKRLREMADAVAVVRSVKEPGELRHMRRAVRIAERGFRELLAGGAKGFVGRSERDLAAELEYRMRMAGAESQAFPGGIIVASGPDSAGCHHRPTTRKVRWGEPVLFDWGALVDGYRSDITRVVFVGDVPAKFREMYAIVLEAHDAAVDAMRPGVQVRSLDRIARGVIVRAGHGEAFRHGLGHGIGLEVHEPLRSGTAPGRPDRLRKHMVMTIEPGIYFDGIGGVRIEDDILVTADGHERLNSLPRSLNRMIVR